MSPLDLFFFFVVTFAVYKIVDLWIYWEFKRDD